MEYKGRKVTLDNYLEEFKNYPQDVLDEIRSSIMDGANIFEWVEKNKDDPYMLQQLRVSIKLGVPDWMLEIPFPQVLRDVRVLYIQNINVDSIKKLLSNCLPEKYYQAQIEIIKSGKVMPDWLDLTNITSELLDFTKWGISRDYPLEGIVNSGSIDKDYAIACLKIRLKGQNIEKFLSEPHNLGVLESLSEVADKPYYIHIVHLLDSTTTMDTVETLISLGKKDFPFSEHDMKSYNSMQLSWIYETFVEGLDFTKLLDPSNTQRDLVTLYHDLNIKDKGKTYRL